MKIISTGLVIFYAIVVVGCSDESSAEDALTEDGAGDPVSDDTAAGDDIMDSDAAPDPEADDVPAGDDMAVEDGPSDTLIEPVESEYTVVVDHALTLEGNPLNLSRLDAQMGSDGRVHFAGYNGYNAISVCSFDASVTSPAGSWDLQCSSIDSGPLFRYPRIDVDADHVPAVIWDVGSGDLWLKEARGHYKGETQTLFSSDITSVNHPDIAFFSGSFTAVSQWYYAIGRAAFSELPADLDIVADWDAGEGGQEPKGPSIAANENEGGRRMAWTSYHGVNVRVKTLAASESVPTDIELTGSTFMVGDEEKTSYPGWSHVAVDDELGIHVAWYCSAEIEPDLWGFPGWDYRHITGPDLAVTISFSLDYDLGDVGAIAPAVAVNPAGDVAVVFNTNLGSGSGVYAAIRYKDEPEFTGGEILEEDRMEPTHDPYTPAVAGFDGGFWILYNGKGGNQLHAVRMSRRSGD